MKRKRFITFCVAMTLFMTSISAHAEMATQEEMEVISVQSQEYEEETEESESVSGNEAEQSAAEGVSVPEVPSLEQQLQQQGITNGYRYSGKQMEAAENGLLDFEMDSYPEKYDPRESGKVSNVRSQVMGSCWLYSAVAAMESNLIKKGYADNSIDLSELQIAYYLAKGVQDPLGNYGGDVPVTDTFTVLNAKDVESRSGMPDFAVDLISRWTGPVYESEAHLMEMGANRENINAIILDDSLEHKSYWHFKESKEIPSKYPKIEAVKELITAYGGVTFGYEVSSGCYRATKTGGDASYYYPGGEDPNHEAEIVGWDDTYSKTNFKRQPKNDGAWLVKNSHGKLNVDGFATSGFFWLSYENMIDTIIAVEFDDKTAYENMYAYEGQSYFASYSSGRNYMNIFEAKAYEKGTVEKIDGVMARLQPNTVYTVTVYVNPVMQNGKMMSYTGKSDTVTGKTDYLGFYTIPFSAPAYVTNGDTYGIWLKTDCDNGLYTASDTKFERGQSYLIPHNDGVWADVVDLPRGDVTGSTVACPVLRGLTNLAEGVILSTSVTVDHASISLKEGESSTITPTIQPVNTTHKSCGYLTTNENVVTVSDTGVVTAVGAGNCNIIVTTYDGESSATVPVTVLPKSPESPVLPASSEQTADKVEIGKLTYQIYEDKTAAVVSAKAVEIAKIPETITSNGCTYKVTKIAKQALKGNKRLKKVIVGKNITEIGSGAFKNCKKLTSVTIGRNVDTIGSSAFYGCKRLKKITVKGKKVVVIGKDAFKKIAADAVINVPNRYVTKFKKYAKKAVSAGITII